MYHATNFFASKLDASNDHVLPEDDERGTHAMGHTTAVKVYKLVSQSKKLTPTGNPPYKFGRTNLGTTFMTWNAIIHFTY